MTIKQRVVILSSRPMVEFPNGRSYSRDLMIRNGNAVKLLPESLEIFSAGDATISEIQKLLPSDWKLSDTDLIIVFLRTGMLDIVEPLVKGLSERQLHWMICDHTPQALGKINRAGHLEPKIHRLHRCDNLVPGYVAWHLLEEGRLFTTEPPPRVIRAGDMVPVSAHP